MTIKFDKKDAFTPEEVQALLEKQESEGDEAVEKADMKASMTDVEKSHYATLTGDAADEFLFMDTSERATVVSKLQDADPVVVTMPDGTEIRKSAGAVVIRLAKDNAKIMADNAELMKKSEDSRLTKLAESEFSNLPGTVEVRKSMIKAIEGIDDETARDAAMDALKAKNASLAANLKTVGTTGGSVQPADLSKSESEEKLDSMAKALQEQNPELGYYDAYDKVSTANPELAEKAVNGE